MKNLLMLGKSNALKEDMNLEGYEKVSSLLNVYSPGCLHGVECIVQQDNWPANRMGS